MKYILIFGLVGILLFFFFRNVNFREVYDSISTINPIYPIVFLLGLYLQFFIRGYRWALILYPRKNRISLLTLYHYTVIGFFLDAIIPGKVGEPAKGILLAREEQIGRSYGLASVVLERLIDSLMIVLLFLVSLFFIRDTTSPLLIKLKSVSFFISPIIVLFFLLFYLLNTERAFVYVDKIIRFLSKVLPHKIRERAVAFGLNFVKGLRLDLSFLNYVKLLISSIVVWVFLIPFYWFLMQGFEFGPHISMVESVPYFSIMVLSAAIPTPGMAGSFDIASKEVLRSSTYNVHVNEAVAYTVLAHFLILLVMIVPGLVSFWIKGINMKIIRNITTKRDEQNNN
ncbi:MAG: lysylphosphatidylglycerol synthase transmembrane domain-containing protein [Candidatus Aminicenantes bacterium]